LSEFLNILIKEIAPEVFTLASEPAESYDKSEASSGQVSFRVKKMNTMQGIDRINNDVALSRLEKILNEIAISTQTNTGVSKPL